jgi:signal transduction histidine kinase
VSPSVVSILKTLMKLAKAREGVAGRPDTGVEHSSDSDRDLLCRQIEDLDHASTSVFEAVASVPESSVRAVLQAIAVQARHLTSAEFAAVGIGVNPKRPFAPWVISGISHEQAMTIGGFPRPIGLLGLVARENRTIRLRDLQEHPDHVRFLPDHPVMTSFLGVPIRYHGRAVGNLYLANKRGEREFTEQDERLVEMLATKAGVAIETARLYAAEGLQHAWLQTVIDQMPEGIVLMDPKGRVTMQNRSMLSLVSSHQDERDRFGNLVTIDLREVSGQRVSPDRLPIVRAMLHKETTHGDEFVIRRSDGKLVPVLISAAPIFTTNGEIAGATMMLEDISTLKELERLREEWTSVIAHDLQQPISTIVLMADALLESDLGDDLAEDVRHIRSAAMRLSRMVTDLMDVSQVEAHRMQISPMLVDLVKLVQEVVERIPETRSRTSIRPPMHGYLFVLADPQRLEQVVTNLLSNALKYSAPGTDIRIDIRQSDRDAKVSVTNRGTAVMADELPHLFDRYFRSRAVRTSTTGGLGLGLYIAKGLVEAHGGRMWVESDPSGATTFHFTIPLEPSRVVAPGGAPPALDTSSSPPELTEAQP